MDSSLLLLQTLSGPAIRYDRLVSLALVYPSDGHCVDPSESPRDEKVYIVAFFDYLSSGMPLAVCQARNAPASTQLLLWGIKDVCAQFAAAAPKQPLPLVLAAIPGTDPVQWGMGSYLPMHPDLAPVRPQAAAPPPISPAPAQPASSSGVQPIASPLATTH